MANGVPQLPTTKQGLFSDLRQIAAIAGITVSATGTITGWKAIASFVGGTVLLIVEHFVGDPSTGSPSPPSGLQ